MCQMYLYKTLIFVLFFKENIYFIFPKSALNRITFQEKRVKKTTKYSILFHEKKKRQRTIETELFFKYSKLAICFRWRLKGGRRFNH